MQQLPYVDVSINDLTGFLFLRNKDNATVELSLEGIENNKDMFMFCIDLFCKGIVLLYGEGSNYIELDKLTMENFDVIRKKMNNAGIEVLLEIDQDQKHSTSSINFDHIMQQPDNWDIERYYLELRTPEITYNIRFKLFHNA